MDEPLSNLMPNRLDMRQAYSRNLNTKWEYNCLCNHDQEEALLRPAVVMKDGVTSWTNLPTKRNSIIMSLQPTFIWRTNIILPLLKTERRRLYRFSDG